MVINNLVSIRSKHAFDLKKLNNWLNENLPNYSRINDIKQCVGGQSNPTYVLFLTEEMQLSMYTQ